MTSTGGVQAGGGQRQIDGILTRLGLAIRQAAWPDFGRTATLSIGDYCVSSSHVLAGQRFMSRWRMYRQISTDLKVDGSCPPERGNGPLLVVFRAPTWRAGS